MTPPSGHVKAALAAADAAGVEIRARYRRPISVEHKEDASPIVTEADVAAERALRAVLEQRTPDAGIIGEELGAVRPGARWQWVLDPIDGTIAFACGKPLFTTLIALLYEGTPVLGVIDQPIIGERWVGDHQGARLNGEPIRAREAVPTKHARIASTAPSFFRHAPGLLERIRAECHVISWGGDAYNYGCLASGLVDAVLESSLAVHDYAALLPVVRGAGGMVTDWEGLPIERAEGRRDVLATGGSELHGVLLEWIADARSGA